MSAAVTVLGLTRWRRMAFFLQLFLIFTTTTTVTNANKDSNYYSFGQNPNIRQRMYWADAAGILDDLNKFSALYVKYHNCAWSPLRNVNFDDDGENRDGDSYWYQGRTTTYAANAAFSLYGTLKSNPFQFGGCSKSTYINSFFTNQGADVLIDALSLNADTGADTNYCQEYDGGDNRRRDRRDRHDRRQLDDGDYPQSYMMGCSADGKFTTALFTDQYCQGSYFANSTVDNDGTFDQYNKVFENNLNCKKIWGFNTNKQTDNGYDSPANEILDQSEVCYLEVFDSQVCPDPWNKKSQDTRYFALAQSGRSVGFQLRYKQPMLVTATLFMMGGLAFLLLAYYNRNLQRIILAGGGTGGDTANSVSTKLKLRGLVLCLQEDTKTALGRSKKSLSTFIKRKRRQKQQEQASRKKKRLNFQMSRGNNGGSGSDNNNNNNSSRSKRGAKQSQKSKQQKQKQQQQRSKSPDWVDQIAASFGSSNRSPDWAPPSPSRPQHDGRPSSSKQMIL